MTWLSLGSQMASENRQITEFDIYFLSYDEPNAEKHWADLLDKCPWAKRVHGVKGFDSAHRACAEQSETDWFITVDADNIVMPSFFDQTVNLDPEKDLNKSFSWNALNGMNGLMYGNGGLKLWSKQFVLNMNSHENSDDSRKAVDFCWEKDYQQVHKTFSEVWNNGSPYQAWRVGFREAVKLSLDQGNRVDAKLMKTQLHAVNLRNLRIWSCVGADVQYGKWAMYGTRFGLMKMIDPYWDYTVIRDYDWFDEQWNWYVNENFELKQTSTGWTYDEAYLDENIRQCGDWIESQTKILFPVLDASASNFFRETFKYRND
jgi:hypothetical protein